MRNDDLRAVLLDEGADIASVVESVTAETQRLLHEAEQRDRAHAAADDAVVRATDHLLDRVLDPHGPNGERLWTATRLDVVKKMLTLAELFAWRFVGHLFVDYQSALARYAPSLLAAIVSAFAALDDPAIEDVLLVEIKDVGEQWVRIIRARKDGAVHVNHAAARRVANLLDQMADTLATAGTVPSVDHARSIVFLLQHVVQTKPKEKIA